VHEVGDNDLKGIVVQVTGAEPSSSTVSGIVGSFKALRAYADFDAVTTAEPQSIDGGTTTLVPAADGPNVPSGAASPPTGSGVGSIKLGYTINLNLPATSDIAVFDAIFKSLREHLLP
jgi:hypothetical protein